MYLSHKKYLELSSLETTINLLIAQNSFTVHNFRHVEYVDDFVRCVSECVEVSNSIIKDEVMHLIEHRGVVYSDLEYWMQFKK